MKSESDKDKREVGRKSERRDENRKGEKVTGEARSGKTCLKNAPHPP